MKGKMMSQDKNTENKKTKMTSKQIFAIAGIVVLVLLYVVTLLAAIFDSSASHALFATCLLATVAIPLLIWIPGCSGSWRTAPPSQISIRRIRIKTSKLRVTSHAKSKQKQRSGSLLTSRCFCFWLYTATAVNEINVERPLRHIYELSAWLVT